MSKYSNLFSPFKLGALTLKNRIVVLPHSSAKIINGVPTDEDIAYWEERARGGAGMIITGATVVHPTSTLRKRILVESYQKESVDMQRKRAAAIHAHGAKIIGQILHLGREMIGSETDYPLIAPSAIQSPRALYRPIEMTKEMIREVIDGFVASSVLLRDAGYDGIEIHGAHGYLVGQFLSSATNFRTDEYGGSLRGRMRFLNETISEIRQATADDFIIGLRLSAEEEVNGGLQLSDTIEIVNELSKTNAVNYLNITLGIRGAYVKDITTAQGIAVPAARAIKKSTHLPVLVSQRIKEPAMAEQIIADGSADLVGMARAMIADPEWPLKAQEGKEREIIPCIGCNQECRDFDPHLLCAVNPRSGREERWGEIVEKSSVSKRVAVVGGGPAGLEAAKVAADRGHRVVLFEQETRLGGQMNLVASAPHRGEMIELIRHMEYEINHRGVEVRLGRAFEVKDAAGFDEVILATGAVPISPKPVGFLQENTLTVADALRYDDSSLLAGKLAVVVDDGIGFWPAFNASEKLALMGCKVTYVTASRVLGAKIPHESIQPLLNRLTSLGVRFITMQQLVNGDQEGNVIFHHTLHDETITLRANLLVVDCGRRQADVLIDQLKHEQIKVHVVGDVLSPRRIGNAIFEAHQAAREI